MTCQETEASLTDLLDRRLGSSDEIRVHAHLESCAACRERAATWEGLTPAMRRLLPPRLSPLAIRRMEVDIERTLAGTPTARSRGASWLAGWRSRPTLLLGTAAVAAVVLLATWIVLRPSPHPPGFATVERISGGATAAALEGRALVAGMTLPAGAEIVAAAGASLSLDLNGKATLALNGPARLGLHGDAGRVLLRLTAGTLTADVVHRQAGETFVVELGGMRIEVRGTRFQAGYQERRPWVAVQEGRVAVLSPGQGEHLVSAGERYQPATTTERTAGVEPKTIAGSGAGDSAGCLDPSPTLGADCDRLARRARTAMRVRHYTRALSFVDDGLSLAATSPGCARPDPVRARAAACLDDLRYLRAEALRLDGRLEQAVATYRSLDRSSAPVAMRQNALYAAGQIEQRLGRPRAAHDSFERALAIAPKGALREEAMLGAMEAAQASGDAAGARAAARRYLAAYPEGRGAPAARRLSGSGPR